MSPHALLRLSLTVLLVAAGCEGPPPQDEEPADTQAPVEDSGPEQSLPVLEAGEAPYEVSEAAALTVRLVDTSGEPLEGLAVEVAGSLRHSSERGVALFAGLEPGDVSIVSGGAEGWATKARMLYLEPGARVTVELTLAPVAVVEVFEAAEGVLVEDRGLSLEVPASGVLDLAGEPWDGEVVLEMSGYSAEEPSMFPGPLLAYDGDELIGLQTHGAFEATLSTPGGEPLFVDPEQPLRVRAATDLGVGEQVPMWVLDPVTGVWLEEPGVVAVVNAQGELEVEIPHLTVWNFDAKWGQCCLDVNVDICPEALSRIQVSAQGAGWGRLGPVPDGLLNIIRVPCGPVDLQLLLDGLVLDELLGVPTAPAGQCEDSAVTLRSDWGSQGSAQIQARFRYGECPAERLWLTATDSEGNVDYADLAEGIGAGIEGLSPDTYTVCIHDPGDTSVVFDCEQVVVQCSGSGCTCPIPITLRASVLFVVPDALCEDPCDAEDCDTCLQVEVVDPDGLAQSDVYVDFYSPVGQSIPTDAQGEVCLDLEGMADRELVVAAEGAWPSAARLPRGAACEDGDCARIQQVVSGQSIVCPAGTARVHDQGRLLGFLDPQYTGDAVYDAPVDGVSSLVRVSASGDLGALGSATVRDAAWAFRRVRQDPAGREVVEGLVVRADMGGHGLSIELQGVPSLGDHMVAEAPLTVVLDSLPTTSLPVVYTAVSGSYSVRSHNGRAWVLSLDGLTLRSEDGDEGTLSADLWVTELFEADVPARVGKQRSHLLNGQYVSVVSAEGEALWGPTGLFGADPEYPDGQLEYCVPVGAPYMLVGLPSQDHHVPFTALMEVQGQSLTLAGNDHEDAWAYTQQSARWFERRYVARVYEANDLDPRLALTEATVFGTAARWNGSTLEPVPDFQRAWLQRGGEEIECPALYGDFSFRPNGSGDTFACPGVPPAEMDAPWTLMVLDAQGQEIEPMRQQIAPVAGGVMVAHN